MTPYRFQRGETIQIGLQAVGASAGDLALVVSLSAQLKPAVNGAFVPDATVAPVATFAVTPIVSSTDVEPGWYLSIDAAACATLEPGTYVTNAVLLLNSGTIEKTEPLFLRIDEATS